MNLSDASNGRTNITDLKQVAMDNYVQCRNELYNKATTCIENISNTCERRKVQVIKTVRARMSHAEMLLKRIPNLKVLHIYRKPAPVMPSRDRLGLLSMYGDDDFVKEAELYCKLLVEDILTERRLTEQYPGQVRSYVFQDYTKDIKDVIGEVLEFVGLHMDTSISYAIDTLKANSKIRRTIAANLSVPIEEDDESSEINRVCYSLFELVGDVWVDQTLPNIPS